MDSLPSSSPEADGEISAAALQKLFSQCEDFQTRQIRVGGQEPLVWVCWLDGIASGSDVTEYVLRPLTDRERFPRGTDTLHAMFTGLVYASDAMLRTELADLTADIVSGCCCVLCGGQAVSFQLLTQQHRSVSTPTAEKTVKGPKDAFVETLRINTGLVRSRLHTPKLKLRQTVTGRESRTRVAVLWLDGIADPSLPETLLRRLEALETDGLLQAAVLEAALSDDPRTPFPQLLHTERPDKVASELLRGRAAVIADGLPLAFIAPCTLPSLLDPPDDDAQHFLTASALRLLRWTALVLSVLAPAFLVAVAMYHQEMIPTRLLLSMIEAKQKVPFPVGSEILGMLITFELLQEAGLRLPDPVGQTVSIIGALIVGQSAVEARVISPIAVIVVALAGVAGYAMPSQDLGAAIRLWRFAMVFAAMLAGLFGLTACLALLIWRLCSLESYGLAYTSPLTSGNLSGRLAALLRMPPWRTPKPNSGKEPTKP